MNTKKLKQAHAMAVLAYGLALWYVAAHDFQGVMNAIGDHDLVETVAIMSGLIQVIYAVIIWREIE